MNRLKLHVIRTIVQRDICSRICMTIYGRSLSRDSQKTKMAYSSTFGPYPLQNKTKQNKNKKQDPQIHLWQRCLLGLWKSTPELSLVLQGPLGNIIENYWEMTGDPKIDKLCCATVNSITCHMFS